MDRSARNPEQMQILGGEGFGISGTIAYPIGIAAAAALFCFYIFKSRKA
jgi:hypothetical protein